MTRIFGFGIGLLLLTTTWAIMIILCLIFSRRKGFQVGFVYILLGVVITAALHFWPKESCNPTDETVNTSEIIIDIPSIPRFIFAGLLIVMSMFSIIRWISTNMTTPLYGKKIQTTRVYPTSN